MNKNPIYLHPTLENLLKFHGDSLLLITSVHHFGTISSFNPTTQTANATIDYTKVNYVYNEQTGNNDTMTSLYPPLIDAPVRFAHSFTNGGVTYPVGVGDRCEIVFNDRDMDAWTFGIKNQQPATARLHDFSDAVIIVGINPPASPIQNFDNARPMLRDGVGTSYVAVNPANGKIQIKNPSQNLETVLQSILTHLNSLASACEGITVPVTTAPGTSGPPLNASTFATLASDFSTDASNLAEILE